MEFSGRYVYARYAWGAGFWSGRRGKERARFSRGEENGRIGKGARGVGATFLNTCIGNKLRGGAAELADFEANCGWTRGCVEGVVGGVNRERTKGRKREGV